MDERQIRPENSPPASEIESALYGCSQCASRVTVMVANAWYTEFATGHEAECVAADPELGPWTFSRVAL
jgi:hypothetical protein